MRYLVCQITWCTTTMSEFSADAKTTRSERFPRKCTLDYLFISIVQYPYCNKFIDLSTAIGVLARVK